jgi:acetyltransferase-like isoleucine patch superfamily enzyme
MLLALSDQPARMLDPPIFASWSARVRRAAGSELLLGGPLFLGCWPPSRKTKSKEQEGIGPKGVGRAVLDLAPGSRLVTDDWVVLGPGTQAILGPEAELRIGGWTYISGNSQVLCRESVEIGPLCAIAWNVLIMDSDSHELSVGGVVRPQTAPVRIGHHVWLGAGVTVLKGVHIGDGAVIGAGSIVTTDIPARSLAAGAPARILKDSVDWA